MFALFLRMKMFVGLCLNYRTTDGHYSLRFRAILIFSEQKLQPSSKPHGGRLKVLKPVFFYYKVTLEAS